MNNKNNINHINLPSKLFPLTSSSLNKHKFIFITKHTKWYKPSQAIIFNNKNLSQIVHSKYTPLTYSNEFVLSFLSFTTLYKMLYSIRKLNLTKTLISLSLTMLNSKLLSGIIYNRRHFINGISLYNCGTKLQIKLNTPNHIKTIDINTIRKLNANENSYYKTLPLFTKQHFFPFIIDDRIYILNMHHIIIDNKEVFDAVLQGKYIKLSDQKVEGTKIVNV